MAASDYHFVTRWRVAGTRQEVYDILSDPSILPRWWPSAFLEVTTMMPGDKDGVGQVQEMVAKGWLPYKLRWRLTTNSPRSLDGFTLQATGDLVGRGIWTLEEAGDNVDVTYDWKIRADKPLIRRLTWLMRPIFAANHEWFMKRGLESLKLELARRRTTDPVVLAAIPAPPGPTFTRRRRA
jgi:hypothetical protein